MQGALDFVVTVDLWCSSTFIRISRAQFVPRRRASSALNRVYPTPPGGGTSSATSGPRRPDHLPGQGGNYLQVLRHARAHRSSRLRGGRRCRCRRCRLSGAAFRSVDTCAQVCPSTESSGRYVKALRKEPSAPACPRVRWYVPFATTTLKPTTRLRARRPRFAGAGIVGFDLAGDELLHPALAPHRTATRSRSRGRPAWG